MAAISLGVASDHPRPTEVDCIMVDKVYASCSQTVALSQIVPVPHCPPGCIAPGTTSGSLACMLNLSASTCTVGAVVPTGTDSINNITYTISAVVTVTCMSGAVFSETLYTTTTVPLYNPSGTTPACTILSGSCSAVVLPNGELSVQATLCLLLQTLARVQLLIPTLGFCVPTPCQAQAVASCPPAALFPPQQS